MEQCFVIQPFDDGGKFDKRYDEVYDPAIRKADLDPYRVDRDPGASIPIEKIEAGIRVSRVCLADITEDNPNVWFELGYAIAARREVVLVCSSERTSRFPFDVQHRNIIRYDTKSPSDFSTLQESITKRLIAVGEKETRLEDLAKASPVATVHGLEGFEIATLVSVSQQCHAPTSTISVYILEEEMRRAGFLPIATTLGIRGLILKEMLSSSTETDENGYSYPALSPTDRGIEWLLQNFAKLKLTSESRSTASGVDIPF